MFIGTDIKRAELKDSYDVIVIGSGISGLTSAAILAKQGKSVLVLEKHYTAGGFTHTFKRRGYEWDVGLHYLGEIHRPESPHRKIFDYITDKQLEWNELDPNYDRIIIKDKVFNYRKGKANLKGELKTLFPEETEAINKYFTLLEDVQASRKQAFLSKVLPEPFATQYHKKAQKYSTQTVDEALSKITENKLLKAFLAGQWGDYGLPPKQASLAMHTSVTTHYFNGACYPVGGSSKIAQTITEVIEKQGGQVLTRAEVEKVLIEKNEAKGVQLNDGRAIKAKTIISSVGMFNSNKLLERPTLLEGLEPSMAHLCLYIGLEGTKGELNLKQTNLWIYNDEDHDAALEKLQSLDSPFPVTYISFPSTKDPKWEESYPNKSTIEIIVPTKYEFFQKWEGTEWKNRPEDYNQTKELLAQRMLNTLYKHCPQLQGKVSYYELSTPLSTQYFSNYDEGEIYGLAHTTQRFANKDLKPKTHIKNFYLTGQDILSAGVAGGLFAGVLTSIAVEGLWKSRKIIKMLS